MAISKVVRSTDRLGAFWVILLCFFASGMSGLIYQVVWVRELVLVFGATTFAVSTVLTVFMGGLALGSFIFGRRSERIKRPLRLYGLIEIGIGVYGLAVPAIFSILPSVYQPFWQWLHLSFFALSITRFFFAALILIVPTALMGATLPVLASFYARDLNRIGLRVGSLYSLNTFGAVLGAAATGFVLIQTLGMHATTVLAAAINIALGVAALILARKYESDSPAAIYSHLKAGAADYDEGTPTAKRGRGARRAVDQSSPDTELRRRRQVVTVLTSFALSGFIALSYEVIWSRVLALIIGSSVYAFSIMLTTFLVGLAFGAYLASRLVDRIRNTVFAFGLMEIGIGMVSLAGAYMFNDLPYIFVQLYRWLDGSGFGVLLFARFLVASLVMIMPTLLLGALFPLVVRILSANNSRQTAGQMVGDVYAANTVGAIAGSFASGFLLIPWFGLLDSLRVCVALNFVIAAALFFVSYKDRPASRRQKEVRRILPDYGPVSGIAISALLIIVVILFSPPWDSDVMSSAVYRYAPSMSDMSRQQFSDYLRRGQGETIFYKEGITATVSVQRQSGERVLKVNGKPEASTAGDMPTQILIGALPLLVREQTQDVLVIGLGSGITLGSVQQFPVRRVTCVELEPAVIEASRHFEDINNRPLEDGRLRLVANDGRNFIYTTDEKFDVIISEPSNPWLTGVANLFTLEYFKRGAERLKDDGVFSQWLQIYEMSLEDLRSLVATFRAAFPYVYIFRGAEGDLMLLGAKRERRLDPTVLNSHFADPKVAADLKRINAIHPADILSRFYLGPREVERFSTGSPLNTDNNALIEFNAPRRVGTAEETVERNVKELLAHAASPVGYLSGDTANARVEARLLLDAALGSIKRKDQGRAEQFAAYSLELAETADAHGVVGELRLARGDEAGAVDAWGRALALSPDHFYTLINLGKVYLTKQDTPRAVPYLDRALQIDPNSPRAHHLRGLAYQAVGDNARAAVEYRKTLPDVQYTRSIPTFYLNFGAALSSLGLYEAAAEVLEQYVQFAPSDFEGHYYLGAAYEILAERSLDDEMTRRAVDSLRRSLSIKFDHPMTHYYLSKAYRRLGLIEQADSEFQIYEGLSP